MVNAFPSDCTDGSAAMIWFEISETLLSYRSTALHKYQLATEQYGRQRSPRRSICFFVGNSRVRNVSLNPLRTP